MHQNTDYPGPDRRVNPIIMEAKLTMLHEDVGDIKTALKELTSAITRLALVEERIATTAAAQERAFKAIAGMQDRLTEIEKKMPEYSRTSIWIDRGVWAAAAAAVMYIAKKVGLV